jgi:hypothetical protein
MMKNLTVKTCLIITLIVNLNMLPGHRERINDLFKVVEQLNPKSSLKQTMLNAIK